MKPDFSGYATKAGLKCSDGRTIMPDAFKHQDKVTVPLVWQHGHSEPSNVLGHAILENRADGVYTYGYFNKTPQGSNSKQLVEHGDITALSIYANQLVEKSKQVFHGVIREVSLVLSGANPGALIDNVTIAHGDGSSDTLEDEAVIYTGLELEHEDGGDAEAVDAGTGSESAEEEIPANAAGDPVEGEDDGEDDDSDDSTDEGTDDGVEHSADSTVQEIYDTMNEEQQQVVHFMVGAALEAADTTAQHSDTEGNGDMVRRNVFEGNADNKAGQSNELSHDAVKGIVAAATKGGSLKDAVEDYALSHGIENIDTLFPDFQDVNGTPEWSGRRVEWVSGVLDGCRHSPFSRIRTRSADITLDEARAKGYVTGALKKEEFFSVTQRTTTPTTIYKKQKLDRDDILDITDFDVVVWMKGEMRLMLEEEIARAVLIGDGRAVDDDDKIKDPAGSVDGAGVRSILNDHEMYVTTVRVNVDDAASSYVEVIEAFARARRHYKGTGVPTLYTTASVHTEMLLSKDSLGRRLYANDVELAAALRVSAIVDVEVMEDLSATLLGIVVNLADYAIGSDKGGDINLFDNFDIDYNQFKYLIETRISGALTKLKSAMVIIRTAAGDVVVVPNVPTFNETTGVVTIVATTGVVYKNGATGATLSTGAQTALDPGASIEVIATAASGKFIADSDDSEWVFQRPRT
jgi:hypothetical protein